MKTVKFFTFLTILLLVLMTGCTKRHLYTEGRYAESVKAVDQRIREAGTARNYDLIELCSSLSQLKQYSRLFACLDQMEDNVQKETEEARTIGAHPLIRQRRCSGRMTYRPFPLS